MESNNLFSKDQFGLRSGYSCVTQLLHVLEEWSKALDSYEQIDVIYLDFRRLSIRWHMNGWPITFMLME